MRRLVLIMVLMIFFSPSINADEGGYTAQFRFDIPNPEPVSTIFEECFIELDLTDNCSQYHNSVNKLAIKNVTNLHYNLAKKYL